MEWLKNLATRAILGILGVVVMLAWWSFTGSGSSSIETREGIPARVWAGGGGKLTIEAESSCAARFSVGFEEYEKDDGRSMETWTKVAAGSHTWTIDVPAQVGGYVDFGCEEPKVGDTLKWRILANGTVADEQSETLNEPLKPGWGFGLQIHFSDYSKGQLSEDD
jgi:hypothetical protein